MPTGVAWKLDRLTCIKETEHGSEPYLWPIIIAEEGGRLQVAMPVPEYAAVPLAFEMHAGQSVTLPAGMDSTLTVLFENRANALVVLVVALFEMDASPRKGSRAVLSYIQEKAMEFVSSHLSECRQANGERGDLRNELAVPLDLASAETDALEVSEIADTLRKPGRFDDSVGFAFWTFSGAGLVGRGLDIALDSNTERFRLISSLQVNTVLPDRCRAQRDAVTQAKARVSGLHGMRAGLQQMLHHATPQQKPQIVAAIENVEAQIPAAEAALAAAEQALKSCQDTFSPPVPPEGPIINM